jgi:gamma-glutamyl:cysteine ligase YbdK (ATP-grasp superfamily)
MKALKSQLATELLADPKARDQLRQFMTSKHPQAQAARQSVTGEFEIRRTGGQAVRATIVPKAKAA